MLTAKSGDNWKSKRYSRTSQLTVALCSSSRGGAVSIRRVGKWGTGNHPHHGDRGLRGVLEHVDGLDLAATTWNQSKGFPRAWGQNCWVGGCSHDDGLSTNWRSYTETDPNNSLIICFVARVKASVCVCLNAFMFACSPGALWEYLYSGTDASLLASCSWWSWGIGEPSLLRHSGVCSPLDGGDRSPWWVGDAGALLKNKMKGNRDRPKNN